MAAEFIPLAHMHAIQIENELYQQLLEKKDKYGRNYSAGIIVYSRDDEGNIYLLTIIQNTSSYGDNFYGRKKGKHIYSFPKGGNDESDQSILETATREFIEETGYNTLLPLIRGTLDNGLFTVQCKGRNNKQKFYFYTFFIPFQFINKVFLNVSNDEIIGKKLIKIEDLRRMLDKNPGIFTSSIGCLDIDQLLQQISFQSENAWKEVAKNSLAFGRKRSIKKSKRKSRTRSKKSN